MSASLTLLLLLGVADVPAFHSAKPVWLEGRETEMNLFAGFRAVVEKPEGAATLRLTASTVYRCFVNGEVLGYGPARAGHGFYRVDEWDMTPLLQPGKNVVAVEVAGYNVNSYYLLDQPAFLQAEVVSGGAVLASTLGAGAPFEGRQLAERVQKTERYSFQRPFVEMYRLAPGWDGWRARADAPFEKAALAETAPKALLARGVPYPEFALVPAKNLTAAGTMEPVEVKKLWQFGGCQPPSAEFKRYGDDEMEVVPSADLQRLKTDRLAPAPENTAPAETALNPKEFAIFDFGVSRTGFVRFKAVCGQPVRVYAAFDEMLTEGDVNWRRLGCVNTVTWDLAPGEYLLEAFEPNTMRHVKIIADGGACTVSNVALRPYENPDTKRASFECADPRINQLFEAARNTYAQNALDVFMDCPHRERAGWLCDSFFTARTAFRLSGNTGVERNFFENYLLPPSFAHLPEGMLPMCYPSDHYNGIYIPNWAMWFVVQLGEYAERGGDPAQVAALRPKVLALLDFFKKYENESGLLEKLESWVFVEWSKANDFVQDVNYPSNMLYAGALDAAGALYSLPELREKAAALRAEIRKQSLKGRFFSDNALRRDGKLEVTDNTTEVCQYFAFYFGVADRERDGELWRVLTDEFGPDRVKKGLWEKVFPANSFIGNMLRMELLSRDGRAAQIMEESVGYLKYMADRTGTLWENAQDNASLNHGFASHAAVTFYRDLLGLQKVDPARKEVEIRFADVPLAWCRGVEPVENGAISLSWNRDGARINYTLSLPEGWTARVQAAPGLEPAAK